MELLLVVGIGAVTLSSVAPLAGRYSQRQALESHAQGALSAIRFAQSNALKFQNDSDWGVYFSQDSNDPYYVVFATTDGTYAGRTAVLDRRTDLPDGFYFTGTSTFVFAKGTGETTENSVTIVNANSGTSRTITIGALGISEIPGASSSSGTASSTADLSLLLE